MQLIIRRFAVRERRVPTEYQPAAQSPDRQQVLPTVEWLDRAHGYIYARWYYLYVALAKLARPIVQAIVAVLNAVARAVAGLRRIPVQPQFDVMAESVHGKVMRVEHARQLIEVNQDLELRDLEKVVPYSRARDIVLANPRQIVVMDCPCRVARGERACQPLDVCLIIGEPFATRFLNHHPDRARRIDAAEAVDILLAEHRRGHVQHAFFKDAMLGRLYAICNCCSCCCAPITYHQNGTPLLAPSGYTARIDLSMCTLCGTCANSCQFDALLFQADGPVVTQNLCMGCGVCASRCTSGALELARDPSRGEPLAIYELLPRTG